VNQLKRRKIKSVLPEKNRKKRKATTKTPIEVGDYNTRKDTTPKTPIPDISIHQEKQVDLYNYNNGKERKLSNPLRIECKPDYNQANKNLTQLLQYKYKNKLHKTKKYGDYHVALAIPQYQEKEYVQNNLRDFKKPYINDAQFIRTLWQLGLGLLFFNGEYYTIQFNEKEVIQFV